MSFFGNLDMTSNWGGVIKQALNQVETHLDKVLDLQPGEKTQSNDPRLDRNTSSSAAATSRNKTSLENGARKIRTLNQTQSQTTTTNTNTSLNLQANSRLVSSTLSQIPEIQKINSASTITSTRKSIPNSIPKNISSTGPSVNNSTRNELNNKRSESSESSGRLQTKSSTLDLKKNATNDFEASRKPTPSNSLERKNSSSSLSASRISPSVVKESSSVRPNPTFSSEINSPSSIDKTRSLQVSSKQHPNRTDTKKAAISDLYATFGIDMREPEIAQTHQLNSNQTPIAVQEKELAASTLVDKERKSSELPRSSKYLAEAAANKKMQSNQAKYQQLIQKLNDSMKSTNEYRSKYNELLAIYNSEKAANKSNSYNQLSSKYKIVESELRSSKEAIQAIKTALDTSDADCNRLKIELEELGRSSNSLSKQNNVLQEKNEKLEQQVSGLKIINEELQEKLNGLERKLLIIEDESRTREAQVLLQTRELRKQKRQIEDEKSNISSIIMQNSAPILKKVEYLQSLLNSKQKELFDKESELDEVQSGMQNKNITLQNKLIEMEDRLLDYESNKRVMEAKLLQYAKLEQQELENNKLSSQLREEILVLRKENELLEQRIEQVLNTQLKETSNADQRKNNNASITSYNNIATFESTTQLKLRSDTKEKDNAKAIERTVDKYELSSPATDICQPKSIASPTSPLKTTTPEQDNGYSATRLIAQINTLRSQLQLSLQQKADLGMELAGKNTELEELGNRYKKKLDLEESYKELEKRYSAALVLLGERTEQVMDLKEQILEIKDIYKQQIEEYVSKN